MEILRHLILLFCLLGIFVSGGLFFSKKVIGNQFLSLFLLFLVLDQLNFLYETSPVVALYPKYFLWIYPVCLLFGPLLWWHFKKVTHPEKDLSRLELLHLIPFVVFVLLGLLPLYAMMGAERLEFATTQFMDYMMPLNYIRTSHVSIYGMFLVFLILRDATYKKHAKGLYLTVITIIFLVAAFTQSYLTAFADNYNQFAIYYILIAVLVVIPGVVLYFFPEVIEKVHLKYFHSTLASKDRERIMNKLNHLNANPSYFLNGDLKLDTLATDIKEKGHHISEVLSKDLKSSFIRYINGHRIAHAKDLLSQNEHKKTKLLAIAFDSGFNNTVTFNKAFVKEMGITPGKFRTQVNGES